MDSFFAFFESTAFSYLLKGVALYLGLLWFASVVWVGRDIVHRSSNILVQMFVILLNILLPVFGLVLYLILRPSKTLAEKYCEEMECQFFAETPSMAAHELCPQCQKPLEHDFLFCPHCSKPVKKKCHKCHRAHALNFQLCPFCGNKQKKTI